MAAAGTPTAPPPGKPIASKVKAATGGAALGGLFTPEFLTLSEYVAEQVLTGAPADVIGAVSRIATALMVAILGFAAGWMKKEMAS